MSIHYLSLYLNLFQIIYIYLRLFIIYLNILQPPYRSISSFSNLSDTFFSYLSLSSVHTGVSMCVSFVICVSLRPFPVFILFSPPPFFKTIPLVLVSLFSPSLSTSPFYLFLLLSSCLLLSLSLSKSLSILFLYPRLPLFSFSYHDSPFLFLFLSPLLPLLFLSLHLPLSLSLTTSPTFSFSIHVSAFLFLSPRLIFTEISVVFLSHFLLSSFIPH
ncbi:unnamed protein product [Acanthosepion pharaonis]|uniref:Uncharacterized protein n=1 Tax=Acanthosepion pharaonis TaxID=158019 RepID=A0A812DJY4_ACAPH|nr:unnamed protein product [Sepia pharaonis]